MSVVNLSSLITNAKRYADLENSNYIGTDEWIDYINFGLRQYWNKINQVLQDYNITEVFFQLIPNQTDYNLPDDYMYTRGFDLSMSPGDPLTQNINNWIRLFPYDFKERGAYNNLWFVGYQGTSSLRYRIMSTFVRFLPQPITGNWVRHTYIPVAPTLSSPDDSLNGYNGFDEYISQFAAYRALMKQELDTSEIRSLLAEWEKTIDTQAQDRNRDIGDKVSDVYLGGYNRW